MTFTPLGLIEEINRIGDEFYQLSQEAAEIAARSGTAWLELRKECKTNAECDSKWKATPDGSREAYLKIYLRGLQAKRGALILEHRMNNNL
jgi:hypothetical protein